MNKRLGRRILHGFSLLALCGVLLCGVRFDLTLEAPDRRGGVKQTRRY